jgi:hypothetical protein
MHAFPKQEVSVYLESNLEQALVMQIEKFLP